MTGDAVRFKRVGYYRSLPGLSRETIESLKDVLRRQRLELDPIPFELVKASALGPKVTAQLARLPIYLARGARSWSGLVVCFPGSREELTTGFVGTPYLRRILHPILELYRRMRISCGDDNKCLYILGERFPDVFLRKFRLLEQVVPHVVVLTGDILRAGQETAIPPIPNTRNETWAQITLCREMQKDAGLIVPLRSTHARLGYIAKELPTGEGTQDPERLDILAYDKNDHSLVAVEIKGPDAGRVEIENLFLQGLEHRNWLEKNKMAVKLIFDGVRGKRINARKRVRLLLAFFEDRVPPMFYDLRIEAMRKDRHLCINWARLVVQDQGNVKVTPFDNCRAGK